MAVGEDAAMSQNQNRHDGGLTSRRRPKITVGTVSTKINFDASATVFKPTDVPMHARRAKEEVLRMLEIAKATKLEVRAG